MQGKLIILEGIDGAGKSTLARAILEYYKEKGVEAEYLGSTLDCTGVGSYIRGLITRGQFSALDVETRTALMFAATNEFYKAVALPAMQKGKVVIADRFTQSTRVYQYMSNVVNDLCDYLDDSLENVVSILVDIGVDTSITRMKQRGELDEFERVNRQAIQERIDRYHALVENGKLIKVPGVKPTNEIVKYIEHLL